jgi:insulysin
MRPLSPSVRCAGALWPPQRCASVYSLPSPSPGSLEGSPSDSPAARLLPACCPPAARPGRRAATVTPAAAAGATAAMNAAHVGPSPTKAPLDARVYRTLTLANEMKVVLASDPASDRAAAAMDVGVGSFSDPEDLPGLAHFLEHMLFLGTAKYPDEEDYAAFVSKCAGYSNAFTSTENTNYHFEIVAPSKPADGGGGESTTVADSDSGSDADGRPAAGDTNGEARGEDRLFEVLDRFAQFFISPLFTESATARELNAVDSEHTMNLQSDGHRLFQVQKACANQRHPFSRFNTGCTRTLRDVPAERGVDVRAALLHFYDKYYSANLMHLSVTGPHTLDQLEDMVVALFSAVENKNCPPPAAAYSMHPLWTPAETGKIIFATTVEESRSLEMNWPVPAVRPRFRSLDRTAREVGSALDYLERLLGYEGAGSLTSDLKARGWIDSLYAACSSVYDGASIFSVSVELTLAGVNHVDDIVSAVFGYIQLVREQGLHRWLYDEQVALARAAFRFKARSEPLHLVKCLSQRMAYYDEQNLLAGPYSYTEYSEALLRRMLQLLTPERMNLSVAGRFVAGTTDATEPWYGAEYRVEAIPAAKIEVWQSSAPSASMSIPLPNPFIADDFSLVADAGAGDGGDGAGPTLLCDTDSCELHYWLDRTFQRPKASMCILLSTPRVYTSPESTVLASFATALWADELCECAYDAELAGINYGIGVTDTGVTLSIAGYNQRLGAMLDAVLERMVHFRADPRRFEVIRDQRMMAWRNASNRQALGHASSQIYQLTTTPFWSFADRVACLESGVVTVDAVNAFLPRLLGRLRAQILVCGNVSETWARDVCERVTTSLAYAPLPACERSMSRAVVLPTEFEVWRRMRLPNEKDENSAVSVVLQVGPRGVDFRTDATLRLLVKTLKNPFYEELRTKQQLGYVVQASMDLTDNVQGVCFDVQGSALSPAEMRARVDAFLTEFRKRTLVEMSDAEFRAFVDSAVATLEEPDQTLGETVARFYHEVVTTRQFMFDRAKRKIEALKSVTKADVIALFDRHVAVGGPERRAICSLVYGSQHSMDQDEQAVRARGGQIRLVSDPTAFKMSRPLYPAVGANEPYEQVQDKRQVGT